MGLTTDTAADTRRTTTTSGAARRRFEIILIRPSHYDDDGYVIQWLRSLMPSNSLAAMNGLAVDAAERRVLGSDVDIQVTSIDEANTRIRPDALIKRIKSAGAGGFLGLVGVQSNQFPRALDIARPFREAGIPVVIGGFHVSGSLAMHPEVEASLQQALSMGISLYAGESEDRIDEVIVAAANGTLKPIYNYLAHLPGLDGGAVPHLPVGTAKRTIGATSSFDAGRGCPFQCSFCTIINVQGRKSRRRTCDDIETIIRRNLAEGIDRYFITDDNFARNKDWEPILDRLIKIRNEPGNREITYWIQVDTQSYRLPRFLSKAGQAHVINVFIGLENINPDNLQAANKRQNKISDYREMLLECKRNGLMTWAGYIIGFPGDTRESILRDIETIKRELPIDLLEFFFLTPLPGSVDHQRLVQAGVPMDDDLNKYDLNHVVTDHPRMSKADLEETCRLAWQSYYTKEHTETVMWRAAAKGVHPNRLYVPLAYFHHAVAVEGIHPLEGGILRRKYRRDRRPGLALENPIAFHARHWLGLIAANVRLGFTLLRMVRTGRRIMRHPRLFDYMDEALTPVNDSLDSRRKTVEQSATDPMEVMHADDHEPMASVSPA
ncbi:MAG: Radical domain protein [Gemmatimonadetes bacterium]|nr:Radical domain protein [Gemmatimonadota bacterium]